MFCLNDTEGLRTLTRGPGVYSIFSITEPKHYVGKSLTLRDRIWAHRNALRRVGHHSYKLQAYYTQKGETNLYVSVLDAGEDIYLDRQERYYFAIYDSILNGFNNPPGYGGNARY